MKNIPLLFLFNIILFLVACKPEGEEKKKKSKKDTRDFPALIESWNKANNEHNIGSLSNLYYNKVKYYGSLQDKNICLENKLVFFKAHADFHQMVVGGVQTEKQEQDVYKCTFLKRVTYGGKSADFTSYLIFLKTSSGWKITTEGDETTDFNLSKAPTVPEGAIKGDFNNDGKVDYAWLVAPKLANDEMSCIGDCISHIRFSDKSIPEIDIENCIGGVPENLGDLNNDGSDEIGLVPGWFTSCWRDFLVWTLKSGSWGFALQPISTHCDQRDQGINPIQIDKNNPGNVIIRYSELTDDGIVIRSKSIPIR